jgi:hypothetical protein
MFFVETLRDLCDLANGKRRQWFNVSAKAASLFQRWVQDWHEAKTLEDVLDRWEMWDAFDDHALRVSTKCVGKKLQIDKVLPETPWSSDWRTDPKNLNEQVLYLVLSLLTTPDCERLNRCPECEVWYVARRKSQKYCCSQCGRRAASRRIRKSSNAEKHDVRIGACRAAWTKYRKLMRIPRKSAAEYILGEANRHLPVAYRLGGSKRQVNFITHNAREIGIPKENL